MQNFAQRLTAGFTIAILLIGLMGCKKEVEEGYIPITTDSNKAYELYIQGRDMHERLLSQQSRSTMEACVAKDPKFALGYLALAFAQPTHKDSLKNLDLALQYAENASEGEKLMIQAFYSSLEGDVLAQGKYLRKLVSSYPKDARAHDLLGNYYYKQQKYPEAITQYTKAIGLNSNFNAPYNNLGYSYRAVEKFDDAEKTFLQYIKLIPNDPNPYDSYAELLLKMGRFDDSIENYKKALEIQPDFHYSYLGIASNLVYLNKPSDARAELENFLSQTQDEGQRREAYFAIAVTYVYEGDFANAIQSIKQQFGMASQGQDITAMAYDQNILGKLQYETGQYDEALASFAEARRVIHSSDLSMSLKQLADRNLLYNETYVALKRGDMESAKAKTDLYREAAVKTGDPNQIRKSYELRGMLALAESNFTEAIENFELGNLENAYSLYHLALAYQGNTDLSKALEYSKKTADFNGLIDLNYALVRTKARLLAEKLSAQLNS